MSWLNDLFGQCAGHVPPVPELVQSTRPNLGDGKIDVFSDTWLFVSNWATSELERLREVNDSAKWNDVQTAAIRGQIKRCKELLALPDKKERVRASRPPPIEDEFY